MNKKTFTAAFGITSAMVMGYVGFNNIVFAEEIEEPVVLEQAPETTEPAEEATATVYLQNNEATPEEATLTVQEEPAEDTKKPTTLVKFVTKADDTKTYQTDVDMELTDNEGTVIATWKSQAGPTELVLELGDYSLKVVNAPEGYIPGKVVNFTLTDSDLLTEDGLYKVVSNSAAWRVQNSNGYSEVGYCLNSNRSSGTGAGDIYTQRALTADELQQYLSEGKQGITDTNQLKREILKVIYNGGKNDRLGLKEKYGITEDSLISRTQTAVWALTNGNGTSSDAVVNELLSTDQYAPDNLDFYVFTNDRGRQNYGSAITMDVRYLEVLNLKALEVYASKVDDENSLLSGATIEIVDADGDVVYSYTSSTEKELMTLGAGVYTMREVNAPEGYELAQDIIFRILEDGTVEIQDGEEWIVVDGNTIVMIDPIIREFKGVERTLEPKEDIKLDLNFEEPKQPKETVRPTVPEIQTGAVTGLGTILSAMALSMVGVVRFKKEM